MLIKWKHSSEGFCDSKCGHYSIRPEFWGRCNPVSFRLIYFPHAPKSANGSIRMGSHDTQKAAKLYAQSIQPIQSWIASH